MRMLPTMTGAPLAPSTVRGVGDPCWADLRVRDSINAGKYLGPRMVCSGWGVTPENGHGRGLIAQTCADVDAARKLAREIADRGADLVKLFITGGVFDAEVPGEPGMVRMDLKMAKAVVEEAHGLGLPTAAHVESTEGVRIALKAGVDSIEHGAPLEAEGHHGGHPRLRGVAAEGERAVSDDGAVDSLSVAHQEDLRPLETGVGNGA